LGFRQNIVRNEWFNEECKGKLQDRNNARIKMLQKKTISSVEEYKEKGELQIVCAKIKRGNGKTKNYYKCRLILKNIQSHKYYKEVKKVRTGFRPRLNFCKDKEGNLITSKDKITDHWVEHFSELLNKGTLVEKEREENESIEIRNIEEEVIPLPILMEVRDQIMILKRNKAPGDDNITAEIIKYAGEEMVEAIYQLIKQIWEEGKMPEEWSIAVLCPIHKKGNKLDCENYRGIALICVVYKLMSAIVAKKLTDYTEQILEEYQNGFRKSRSTADHIFSIRMYLEKCYEHNIDLYNLFIDFKQFMTTSAEGNYFK
jgi:hypothetical protein